MKVAINGHIIDIKDIFIIHPVIDNTIYHYDQFTITLFNGVELVVEAITKEGIKASKEELIAFRKKIISTWNRNKSEIKQFNL